MPRSKPSRHNGRPGGFAQTAIGRFANSWPVDHFSEFRVFLRDKYPGVEAPYMDLYAWAGTAFYVVLGLLAIWGFAVAPGRTFKGLTMLVLLHYGLTSMLAHPEFRYRMPLYPFASLYGGWTLASLAGWVRERRKHDHPEHSELPAGGCPWRQGSCLLFLSCSAFLSCFRESPPPSDTSGAILKARGK